MDKNYEDYELTVWKVCPETGEEYQTGTMRVPLPRTHKAETSTSVRVTEAANSTVTL